MLAQRTKRVEFLLFLSKINSRGELQIGRALCCMPSDGLPIALRLIRSPMLALFDYDPV
jgi:hypothetical protein